MEDTAGDTKERGTATEQAAPAPVRRHDQPRITESVPIILDGDRREYRLRMTYKAMKVLKQTYQMDLWNDEVWVSTDPEVVARMIWGGLLHEDPDLSVEDVEEMLDLGNTAYYQLCLNRLWGATMPEPDPATAGTVEEQGDRPNESRPTS